MKQFYQKINMSSRTEMVNFLWEHFRFRSSDDWWATTNYANDLKIHHLGLSRELERKAFGLLHVDNAYIEVDDLISKWGRNYNYQWQASFDDYSGGYLILCRGGIRPTEYKSVCTNCGELDFQTTEKSNRCGVCSQNTRINLEKPHMMITIYLGCSTDRCEDFEDWSLEELRERVKLVQSFDQLCDDIVAELIHICENFEVVEQEICVPKTIRVLQEV